MHVQNLCSDRGTIFWRMSVCSMVSAQSDEVHRPLVAEQEHRSVVPASKHYYRTLVSTMDLFTSMEVKDCKGTG